MKTAINAYKLLSHLWQQNGGRSYEIAGLGTIGPAYLFVNDRSINTLEGCQNWSI